jgi:hypothetical protein
MRKDYWLDIVEKLNDGKSSNWASHVLECGLIEYDSLDQTNLGELIKYVPMEKIIQNTINAYKYSLNQPYCDSIIISLGKITIPYLIENINSNNSRIREGVLSVLHDLDKTEGEKLATTLKEKEKSTKVLKLIKSIIVNSCD